MLTELEKLPKAELSAMNFMLYVELIGKNGQI
jgi:hypothetical protein